MTHMISESPALAWKMLRVTMPDTSVWLIPCEFIAMVAATYAARKHSRREGGDYESFYQQCYDTLLSDESQLLAVAAALEWEDVEGEATRLVQPLPVPDDDIYGKGWVTGEKLLVAGPQPPPGEDGSVRTE